MEHQDEQPSELRATANKYQGVLRDYVARLKTGGLTEHEAKAIYKVVIPRLNRLSERTVPLKKKPLSLNEPCTTFLAPRAIRSSGPR